MCCSLCLGLGLSSSRKMSVMLLILLTPKSRASYVSPQAPVFLLMSHPSLLDYLPHSMQRPSWFYSHQSPDLEELINKCWASKMDGSVVKILTEKSGNLSSIPLNPEQERTDSHKLPSDLHMHLRYLQSLEITQQEPTVCCKRAATTQAHQEFIVANMVS